MSSVKAICANQVVLLTGEKIKDDNPNIVQEYGTEEVNLDAIYGSILELTKSLGKTYQAVQTTQSDIAYSHKEIKTAVTSNLNKVLEQVREVTDKLTETIEMSSVASENLVATSSSVRKLGSKLDATLAEFEEQIQQATAL